MDLGETIKNLRKKRGVSQKDLALAMGISPNALCNIEKGVTFPHKQTIAKICDALQIPVGLLLFASITENEVPKENLPVFRALREPMLAIFEKEFIC